MLNVIDLNGTWKLRWSSGQRNNHYDVQKEHVDERRFLDAAVPGEVHLDLLAAGLIDDPYVQGNVLKCRWVEEMWWSYRRTFEVPADAAGARAWLAFDQLDYAAIVLLNGQEVGRHSNVFYPCRIDVTGKLKPGTNTVIVHLDPGLFGVADKPGSNYGFAQGWDQYLTKRHWLRKPQCQFEWDWSQRLINVGITGPARLEWTDAPARLDQFVPLAEVSPDLRGGSVRVRQFIENWTDVPVNAELAVELLDPSGAVVASASAAGQVWRGVNPVEARLELPAPRLWWPAGHGEQPLYTLRAVVRVNGRELGRPSANVAFRRVRINQDPHPVAGRYFILEINNRPIFVKGGNLVPADMIFARLDRARYEGLTDLALEQNFNMLRVWGGGLYESDDFYDLCDRKGILVWQEFIYACSRYPIHDIEFFTDIQREARWNVRRLASHPSLVVWCGNNELEWGAWDWNYPKDGHILPDHALFHITLPRILAEEDPTRPYHPSSPYSAIGIHPNIGEMGDQHPWRVSFGTSDFREYRSTAARFPNEGGFLGSCALPTVLACLPPSQRFIGSLAWETHDNSMAVHNDPVCVRAMNDWLGFPERPLAVEDWVYWAGLLQGEALREYCENFRRRMFDTASAIFWMYNDTWPCVRSWTTVDYYLRRTPAFHPVRRAMQPVHVVVTLGARRQQLPKWDQPPTVEPAETVRIFGVNDTAQPVSAELRYGTMNLAGGFPVDRTARVMLAPNASTVIAEFDASQWTDHNASAAFAVLSQGGKMLSRNRLLLPLFKEIHWPKANVRVTREAGQAVFTSDTFAWGVCLDLDGEQPLADNFFDVWPGVPYAIPWSEKNDPRVLRIGNLAR